jgi:single-strand DNA-binding protein
MTQEGRAISFAGNLTDDPEVRSTDSGIARAMFRVAISGRREQEASFFTVVVWRDQAEHAAQSLSKGSRVVVVGRLQQRSWTAEDGSARSVVEVVRDHLEEIRDETGYSVPAGVADEIASLVERLR